MSSGERCDRWIGLKVVTEGGKTLGWSKKVVLDENNQPIRLIMTPIKWLPAIVSGTYELSFDEIVGNEPSRNLWIAYEDAEQAVVQAIFTINLDSADVEVYAIGYRGDIYK